MYILLGLPISYETIDETLESYCATGETRMNSIPCGER